LGNWGVQKEILTGDEGVNRSYQCEPVCAEEKRESDGRYPQSRKQKKKNRGEIFNSDDSLGFLSQARQSKLFEREPKRKTGGGHSIQRGNSEKREKVISWNS